MSVEVTYPARVTSYSIFFSEDKVQLELTGIEKIEENDARTGQKERNVARIDFIPVQEGGDDAQNFNVLINRGGFLQATRPLYFLSSILVMLEQGNTVFIDENGNFSKTVIVEDLV